MRQFVRAAPTTDDNTSAHPLVSFSSPFSSVVFIDRTPECRGSSDIGHQFDKLAALCAGRELCATFALTELTSQPIQREEGQRGGLTGEESEFTLAVVNSHGCQWTKTHCVWDVRSSSRALVAAAFVAKAAPSRERYDEAFCRFVCVVHYSLRTNKACYEVRSTATESLSRCSDWEKKLIPVGSSKYIL